MKQHSLRYSDELHETLEAARGDVARNTFIVRALEVVLGVGPGPIVSAQTVEDLVRHTEVPQGARQRVGLKQREPSRESKQPLAQVEPKPKRRLCAECGNEVPRGWPRCRMHPKAKVVEK